MIAGARRIANEANKLRWACLDRLPMDFTLIADPSTVHHLLPAPTEIEELMRRLHDID